MKKIISMVLLILLFTVNLTACQAVSPPISKAIEQLTVILQIDNPVMTVNGIEINIDEEGTAPIVRGGRTLVPVRAVIEALGGRVGWNEQAREVTLTMGTNTIRLITDSTSVWSNGMVSTLEVAPVVIGGRTMMPVRLIAEQFGFDVHWNDEDQRVTISRQDSSSAPTDSILASSSPPGGGDHADEGMTEIRIMVGTQLFKGKLYDSKAARAWLTTLPAAYDMREMNGNEKYYYLPEDLPSEASRPEGINAGDIMLYGSDCVVLFYQSFRTSYSYTRLGVVDNPSGLREALGTGNVIVEFSPQR